MQYRFKPWVRLFGVLGLALWLAWSPVALAAPPGVDDGWSPAVTDVDAMGEDDGWVQVRGWGHGTPTPSPMPPVDSGGGISTGTPKPPTPVPTVTATTLPSPVVTVTATSVPNPGPMPSPLPPIDSGGGGPQPVPPVNPNPTTNPPVTGIPDPVDPVDYSNVDDWSETGGASSGTIAPATAKTDAVAPEEYLRALFDPRKAQPSLFTLSLPSYSYFQGFVYAAGSTVVAGPVRVLGAVFSGGGGLTNWLIEGAMITTTPDYLRPPASPVRSRFRVIEWRELPVRN